jgi:hypothetical protein
MIYEEEPQKATNIQEAIPERTERRSEYYYAEYGVRSDDHAMVIQIFVPTYSLERLTELGKLPERFNTAVVTPILEQAAAVFSERGFPVHGRYSPLLDSYYLAVTDLAQSMAPDLLLTAFFDRLDKLLHEKGSES